MAVVGFDHVQASMPDGYEDDADALSVAMLGFTAEEKPAVLAAAIW